MFFYLAYDLTAAQAIYEQTAAETLATSALLCLTGDEMNFSKVITLYLMAVKCIMHVAYRPIKEANGNNQL